MRKTQFLLMTFSAVALSGIVLAQQNQAPGIPDLVFPQKIVSYAKDLLVLPVNSTLSVTRVDPKRESINIKAKGVSLAAILEELAKQTDKKILLSDELRAKTEPLPLELSFEEIPLYDLLDVLGRQAYFSWGRFGKNFLIFVPRTPEPTAAASPTMKVPTYPVVPYSYTPVIPYKQTPDKQTPTTPFILPRIAPGQPEMPPGSTPFEFNGQTLYLVPLDK